MNRITQIERILQILSMLATGDRLTSKIVVKRLDNRATRRDVQRDFLKIIDARLPIDYEIIGREKIYFFNPGYQARLAPMFENRIAA